MYINEYYRQHYEYCRQLYEYCQQLYEYCPPPDRFYTAVIMGRGQACKLWSFHRSRYSSWTQSWFSLSWRVLWGKSIESYWSLQDRNQGSWVCRLFRHSIPCRQIHLETEGRSQQQRLALETPAKSIADSLDLNSSRFRPGCRKEISCRTAWCRGWGWSSPCTCTSAPSGTTLCIYMIYIRW